MLRKVYRGELSGRRLKGLDGGAPVIRAWSMDAAIEAEGDSIPATATFTARSGDTQAGLMVGDLRVESTMVGRGRTGERRPVVWIHWGAPSHRDPPIHPSAQERRRGRSHDRCSCQTGYALECSVESADREDEQGESVGRLPIRSRPSLDAVESQKRKEMWIAAKKPLQEQSLNSFMILGSSF